MRSETRQVGASLSLSDPFELETIYSLHASTYHDIDGTLPPVFHKISVELHRHI